MNKKGNKGKHLTDKERFCIEKLCKQNEDVRYIAKTLGRGKTTIADEIKANGGKENYNAKKAINRAFYKQYRKKRDCLVVAIHSNIATFVERKLRLLWSPEDISGHLQRHNRGEYVSPKAIRKYIKSRGGLERYLFWSRVKKKSGPKKKNDIFLKDEGRKCIDLRPETNNIYGHWEGDFVVSKHNSYVLLVLVEKYTGKTLINLLPNRKNDLVNKVVSSMLSPYEVKSLTLDNDIAFSKWRELELDIKANIYFCHPYSSWEKGLVENTNRWIRSFVPKGSDLSKVTDYEINQILTWLNYRPRERNDFETSYDMIQRLEKNFHQLSINWSLSL